MTTAHHSLDVYGVELHLATTRREWAALRRRYDFMAAKPESAGLVSFAVWTPKGSGRHVPHAAVWIDDTFHADDLDLIDTCAHEASHVANHILDYIGHEIRGTDEPHAYLIGWLTRWLWENVGRQS
jgi:hypothetical protein